MSSLLVTVFLPSHECAVPDMVNQCFLLGKLCDLSSRVRPAAAHVLAASLAESPVICGVFLAL